MAYNQQDPFDFLGKTRRMPIMDMGTEPKTGGWDKRFNRTNPGYSPIKPSEEKETASLWSPYFDGPKVPGYNGMPGTQEPFPKSTPSIPSLNTPSTSDLVSKAPTTLGGPRTYTAPGSDPTFGMVKKTSDLSGVAGLKPKGINMGNVQAGLGMASIGANFAAGATDNPWIDAAATAASFASTGAAFGVPGLIVGSALGLGAGIYKGVTAEQEYKEEQKKRAIAMDYKDAYDHFILKPRPASSQDSFYSKQLPIAKYGGRVMAEGGPVEDTDILGRMQQMNELARERRRNIPTMAPMRPAQEIPTQVNTAAEYYTKDQFLKRVAQFESRGNYSAQNPTPGMTAKGKYQITDGTARELGYDPGQLYGNPQMQEEAASKLYDKRIGNKKMDKYEAYIASWFFPAAAGKPDDYIIGKAGSKTALAHQHMLDASGNLTKGGFKEYLKKRKFDAGGIVFSAIDRMKRMAQQPQVQENTVPIDTASFKQQYPNMVEMNPTQMQRAPALGYTPPQPTIEQRAVTPYDPTYKQTFGQAFSVAREKLGPGQQFDYKGKSFSTDYAPAVPVAPIAQPQQAPIPQPGRQPVQRPAAPGKLKGPYHVPANPFEAIEMARTRPDAAPTEKLPRPATKRQLQEPVIPVSKKVPIVPPVPVKQPLKGPLSEKNVNQNVFQKIEMQRQVNVQRKARGDVKPYMDTQPTIVKQTPGKTIIHTDTDNSPTITKDMVSVSKNLPQFVKDKHAEQTRKGTNGKNYFVVDKETQKLYFFDSKNNFIKATNVLTGYQKGDMMNTIDPDGPIVQRGKYTTTPGGEYKTAPREYSHNYPQGFTPIISQGFAGTDGTGRLGAHEPYLYDRWKERKGALTSPIIEDNRMSYGCINIEDMKTWKEMSSEKGGDSFYVSPEDYDTKATARNMMKKPFQYQKFEGGGQVPLSRIEVEGGEVAMQPGGRMIKFNGPKHTQGGISTDQPENTFIWSDQVMASKQVIDEFKGYV